MTEAKTPAQRQADRKARQIASGLVQFKRWVHADDVDAMREAAAKLDQRRQKESCTKPERSGIIPRNR